MGRLPQSLRRKENVQRACERTVTPSRRQRDCYVVAQLRFKLRSSLRKKLPTRRARFRKALQIPRSTKYVSRMLSRVFTSGPTGLAECQVSFQTAKASRVFGANAFWVRFGLVPSGNFS